MPWGDRLRFDVSAEPNRVREVFLAALDQPSRADREVFLDEACGGNTTLRGMVAELLRAHDRPDPLLDRPAADLLDERDTPSADGPTARPTAAGPPLPFLDPSRRDGSLGRLGHYEALEVVGRGGTGLVFRGFDEKLNRTVAIKVLAPEVAIGESARRRFAREARAAAAVVHENVIAIHAVEDAGPVPLLVMAFVAGPTLQQKIDRAGPLDPPAVARIGSQIAAGLAAAHRHGLVHRDIKPANVLLESEDERVRITDFGLARAVDDASVTQSGVVAGTPLYMSPEQANGEPVDHRSDLFSLGSVLYAMCTGRPPFRGGTTLVVLKRVIEDKPPPPREHNPAVSDWLAAIIDRLMAKDPARRFQSADEVATLLAAHLAHLEGRGPAPAPIAVRAARRPTRRAAVAAGLIAVTGATGVWCLGRPGGRTPPPDPSVPDPFELANRPSAADTLDPKDIPAAVRDLLAFGDQPALPGRLVAVVGDPPVDPKIRCQCYALAVSPDGQVVATAGWGDGTVRVWDLATGRPRQTLSGFKTQCYTLTFRSDGQALMAGDEYGTAIRIWHPDTGLEQRSLVPAGQLFQVVVSPDGRWLATAGWLQQAVVWDLSTGRVRDTLQAGESFTTAVAFSPDGTLLAGGGFDGTVQLWDAATGATVATLPGNGPEIRWLGFHPDGKSLVVSPSRRLFSSPTVVWDLTTRRVRHKLAAPIGGAISGVWRADGRVVFLAGAYSGAVRVWNLADDEPRFTDLPVIRPNQEWLHAVTLTPEGRHMIAGHPSGYALVFRLANRGEVFDVPAPK
jgi:Protein kinase domain/WD domain, G-beta repeat